MSETVDAAEARRLYLEAVAQAAQAFLSGALNGSDLLATRTHAVEELFLTLFRNGASDLVGVAAFATGGSGRRELFPASDLDLLFVLQHAEAERTAKDSIRRLCQHLWDSTIRVAATTRLLAECERYDSTNAEFVLSLLDLRFLAGDQTLATEVTGVVLPMLLDKQRPALTRSLVDLTGERHARYGETLFHLEPNIKDCPGGLRDVHACRWLETLTGSHPGNAAEFLDAFRFLTDVRCFLHLRAGRDANALDWRTQDAAAGTGIGVPGRVPRDPAHWMQLYFRHARVVSRRLEQQLDSIPQAKPLFRWPAAFARRSAAATPGLILERGRILLDAEQESYDPAHDPDVVLRAFQTVADTGAKLAASAEARIQDQLPALASLLGDDVGTWHKLRLILLGRFAGAALRSMHALGVLDLLVPEFHGIDALVIRDAYHRYTVDEHTFVLIDALHSFDTPGHGALAEWKKRFASVLNDVQHLDLLYLASLLHDTGKGRAGSDHTLESARLARSVLSRWEFDDYEANLTLQLISNHLEMSAALRRDIFDAETVRGFAARVQTPEELRMLTLFTYADIHAVHPDALTPWKAEYLWRLYIATSNYLDRNIDDERFDSRVSSELVLRVAQTLPGESRDLVHFLEGFPQRYLRTRSPEHIRTHYAMSRRLGSDPVQIDFTWNADRSELTILTPDRQMLFSRIAGVLAAWGMNIITADAFSNAQGIILDSFRFTDSYKTLELNPSERDRLLKSVHDSVTNQRLAAEMIAGRKRSRRHPVRVPVETSVHFDSTSSTHSTLLQVIAQDVPGLLYVVSSALGEAGCNIEVAVIDTEGDTAIDVFYLTHAGLPLDESTLPALQTRLRTAIDANANA